MKEDKEDDNPNMFIALIIALMIGGLLVGGLLLLTREYWINALKMAE